jgi:hypothetical protein
MRIFGLGLVLVLLSLTACSPYGTNQQVPRINGVPVIGPGMGGGGFPK